MHMVIQTYGRFSWSTKGKFDTSSPIIIICNVDIDLLGGLRQPNKLRPPQLHGHVFLSHM